MSIHDFIRKRPYLVWSTQTYDTLSKDAVVEAVLQHGDFDDVRKLLRLLGTSTVSRIFRRQLKRPRVNYDPRTANYFNLYFRRHPK